ncbi:unnamed protein product [Spirodela intermedia]|uniref:Uncharacterized protein n=1 Tax=Spirodela intermedia TaxID=51605 RepID=A0ABN7E9X9_SPIIN|nr:unnamed protein product [Spirodela intermedia]
MMNSLPIKKRDPGAPMITSEIGGMIFTRSLLDTGASINILPKVVYDRHHVGELQPFLIELCLADGSVRKPHGIVEDVIVRIEGCYFPVDFLVVDMKITKELSQAPIILGRPFLATAKAVTDWGKGEVILKVGEHTVKVNINKLMKYPSQAFEDLGSRARGSQEGRSYGDRERQRRGDSNTPPNEVASLRRSHVPLARSHLGECHSDCVTPLRHSRDV